MFNVVTGLGRDVGEPLVRHPKVRGITFTGSTSVGRKIASIASERMARIHMELGGKNPVIVLRDANLEEAAAQIALGAIANSEDTGGDIPLDPARYDLGVTGSQQAQPGPRSLHARWPDLHVFLARYRREGDREATRAGARQACRGDVSGRPT